jgi:translation elongation factor EF-Ts
LEIKITNQQTIAETLNEHFVTIAENINRRKIQKTINDENDNIDNHTHFMEQAFNP